jgi:hypothetical protein
MLIYRSSRVLKLNVRQHLRDPFHFALDTLVESKLRDWTRVDETDTAEKAGVSGGKVMCVQHSGRQRHGEMPEWANRSEGHWVPFTSGSAASVDLPEYS